VKELNDIGKQLRGGIKYAERILGVSSNDPLFKQKIEFNSCLNCLY
jgi:hypothetical protein